MPEFKSPENQNKQSKNLSQSESAGISQSFAPPAFQLKASNADAPVQKQEAPQNETGMPDDLKSGVESLSGMDMGDVNVHYNSSKPGQLKAHAYAQGADIHIGPGQEQHLPHEAWHVAQQKQGRVEATTERGGAAVNDDPGLEKEADDMGVKAMQMKSEPGQLKKVSLGSSNPVQGYFREGKWTIADDGKMAVKKKKGLQGGGHEAYAEAGKAAESNNIRKDSPVELYEAGWFGKKFKDEKGGKHKLVRVKAKNKNNNTKGNSMKLDHDCGTSSSKVMGAPYDRKGVHSGGKETSSSYSPFTYKAEMFKEIFQRRIGTWKTNLKTNEDHKVKVDKRLGENEKLVDALKARIVETRTNIDAAKLSKENSEAHVGANSKEYTALKKHSDWIDSRVKAVQDDIDFYERIQESGEYTEATSEKLVKAKLKALAPIMADILSKKKIYLGAKAQPGSKTNSAKMTEFETAEADIATQTTAIPQLQEQLRQDREYLVLATAEVTKDKELQPKLQANIDKYKLWIASFEKNIADADAVDPQPGADFHRKSEEQANVYTMAYRTLPADFRDGIDKELGINKYADPEIGEGYTTVRGGPQNLNPDGSVDRSANWNFHWGGVILKSGSDNMTLENDAGTAHLSNADNENSAWRFDILGTQKKGQSFHEHHQYAHSQDPTTMVVKSKKP